jgi:hypothetical protein
MKSELPTSALRPWIFPGAILLLTCFGVFVLPFLLAPPVIAGVSAANAAGFNNKVAAVAAALLSAVVLLKEFRWPAKSCGQQRTNDDLLSTWFVLLLAGLCGALTALSARLVILSQERYLNDAGYFMEQISSHADYGRRLYDQIEFPYGPLLFYGPVFLRRLLAPFRVSLAGAYFSTLVLEQILGMVAVGYIINNLPMRRTWKYLTLLLCVPLTVELSFGLNHTFFRFAIAPAFLVLAATRLRLWTACLCLFAGQIISFAVSPEMGFAFAVGGSAYAVIRWWLAGRRWLVAAITPAVATVIFLLLAGGAYLRMLRLFARGLYNLIVEPLPHIVVFLFALVWIVPLLLAFCFRERRHEAPLLGSLYVFAVVLLPVAFGRADPGHVVFNGFLIFFLSMAGIANWKPKLQLSWIACVAFVFLWAAYIDTRAFEGEFRAAIHSDVLHHAPNEVKQAVYKISNMLSPAGAAHYFSVVYDADQPFDMARLQAVTGGSKIATPDALPLKIEVALKHLGQYVPSFYCFQIAVLDALSEGRKIDEVNQVDWALIPKGEYRTSETPESTAVWLGFALPYRLKRQPYVAGVCFDENFRVNWRPIAEIGQFEVLRRNDKINLTPVRLCLSGQA